MEKNTNKSSIKGYIEGYYGKLLSWQNRELIVKSLSKNKMNTYFYAPKEDINHRLFWRKQYSKKWLTYFHAFTNISKKCNVKIIAGIAPGLDFNFKNLKSISNKKKHLDFEILLKKAKQLLNSGATSVALLLDDIPDNFKKNYGKNASEGLYHGILANELFKHLNQNIYFVPRIYADELIKTNPEYLNDLSKVIHPEIKVFYCGQNVVSKTLKNYKNIYKILKNEIIFWDNYFANDYCPRRFFIGPTVGREKIRNIMINPTGLINTDLLILDLFAKSINKRLSIKELENILNTHNVPRAFMRIKKFFISPHFGSNPLIEPSKVKAEYFEALDFLLWKWKGSLAREWYPFLLGLKHDLQINKKKITSERIIKTQTTPLSKLLIRGDF